MCLDNLNDYTHLDTYKQGVGWKVFNKKSDGSIDFWTYTHIKAIPNTWLTAKPVKLIEFPFKSYIYKSYYPGFHIFLEKPSFWGDHEVCLPVKFVDPICTGQNEFGLGIFPCVVAKGLYIELHKDAGC